MQKLASKFIEVMRDCSHISKNGKNDFHGYKYATSADVLERVNAALVENHVAFAWFTDCCRTARVLLQFLIK